MIPSTKRCSSIFDLGPLTPKIYSPKVEKKSPISRLVWHIDRRCLGLLGGFWGWPIQWKHAKCCGADPCCHGNEMWARRGEPVAYWLVLLSLCSYLLRSYASIEMVAAGNRRLCDECTYKYTRHDTFSI